MNMPILDFLIRLSAALLMGACVGLERHWRQRMACTRNALVAAGAAAIMMCGFMARDNSRHQARLFPASRLSGADVESVFHA